MTRRFTVRRGALIVAITAALLPLAVFAQSPDPIKSAVRQDRVVAGSPNDFQEVRHLVLKGTNEEIGRALAAIGRERHQIKPGVSRDAVRTRAQRRYLERNYPHLLDRMRGVASAFGQRIDDDTTDFNGLGYLMRPGGGCSVMFIPPSRTASGRGLVSRNYDFTTGTIDGRRPPQGELPCTARPYVLELHPNRGYGSLSICSYDLLNGVLDGINSEGLTVALLADDELAEKFKMEPALDTGVGLGVQQVLRVLLDTCANVEEAKEALLTTKQFYELIPVHYMVADRHGKSFVWEYSQAHNREYIVENPGQPLISTNFSLHRYMEGTSPPSAQKVKSVCSRYCLMADRLAHQQGKVSESFVKETHKAADALWSGDPARQRASVRTLWHALYQPETRSIQVSFYLRDEAPAEKDGKPRIARTDYLSFALPDAKSSR
jgi:hypothetical protein